MRDTQMKNLMAAILEGDCAQSVALAAQLSGSGISSEHIVIHGIEAAMLALDGKCTLEQFNLLEIMVSGLEVLERIRSDERTKMIPVVVLTSSEEEKDRIESYKLGVNSYIVKPVGFESFANVVSEIGFYWILLNKPPF